MDAKAELLADLETIRDCVPLSQGNHYRFMWDFVLRHGTWYEPRAYPPDLPPGAVKQCFGNSIMLSLVKGYRYVEGFAVMPPPFSPMPIHHAWNADAFGALIDSTWRNGGVAYLGVEFSAERADDATWNGDASVLDDFRRGHPLFKEPWQGEDWSRRWPENERVTLLRSGKIKLAHDRMVLQL
jgi:hypothetical protein